MLASDRRYTDTVLPSASATVITALEQEGGTLDAWLLREENHAPLNGGGFVNRDHELGALRRVAPLREVCMFVGATPTVYFVLIGPAVVSYLRPCCDISHG